jgi:hypothetical protein
MPGGNNHSVENISYFSSLQIIDLAGNSFNGALHWELFSVFKSMIRPQMENVTLTRDMGDIYNSY